jgi:hypothetical protein
MTATATVLQFEIKKGAPSLPARARPRIAMPNHNPPLVSHAPPVRLSRTERRFFSDLVQVVCLSTVAVCRETGRSPRIGNREIKRRLTFIAVRLKANERAMFERAVAREGLDEILDLLATPADGAEVETQTAYAVRRNGYVIVLACPYCGRPHSHGPASENGGSKVSHCARGSYTLSIEGEAA